MFVSSPNSHVEIWTPNVMVLGGDKARRVEASWVEFALLLTKPQRALLPLTLCEDTARRWPSMKHYTVDLLAPWSFDFPASRTVRSESLFISCLVCGIPYSSPKGLRLWWKGWEPSSPQHPRYPLWGTDPHKEVKGVPSVRSVANLFHHVKQPWSLGLCFCIVWIMQLPNKADLTLLDRF